MRLVFLGRIVCISSKAFSKFLNSVKESLTALFKLDSPLKTTFEAKVPTKTFTAPWSFEKLFSECVVNLSTDV